MKFIFKALFFLFLVLVMNVLLAIFPKLSGLIFIIGFIVLLGVLIEFTKGEEKGNTSKDGRGKPVEANVVNVKNEYNTTVNIQVNYNVSLNVLGLDPGFGKRELKRAKKDKLIVVKQERKQIGFFDKDGKVENKNKVERIEQSYKNLLEHVK